MSRQYKRAEEVPLSTLYKRLDELSDAILGGRDKMLSEFDMRIPAELDRDADLVLSNAADRLKNMEDMIISLLKLDDELALLEDALHGSAGASITNCRTILATIKPLWN